MKKVSVVGESEGFSGGARRSAVGKLVDEGTKVLSMERYGSLRSCRYLLCEARTRWMAERIRD